jgi:BirA family biotin operon repressor/biotin-[acetyl-CoA-carboxylase] ligase
MTQTRALPLALSEPLARVWRDLRPLVSDVRWYASTTSTMDVAMEAARDLHAEGLVVVADEQTAGRGRGGRVWASPAGAGLYFSILLRPPAASAAGAAAAGPSVPGLLTLAAGVAVAEGVATATGLAVTLKWPNDVYVGPRKLAGILAEAVTDGTGAQSVVLGVGVNLLRAAYPREIANVATSVESELGRVVDRGTLLAAILGAMARRYAQLLEGHYDDVLRAWLARAPAASGAPVEWETPGGMRRGVTAGIDQAGALLVRTGSGVERVISGELRWR